MKLLIATRNRHKLEEIRAIFDVEGIELLSTDDVSGLPEVEEDRDTFTGNSSKKAVELALASGLWSMADDSGLEVFALDGAPGVYSARYAGDGCSDDDNMQKLLDELSCASDRTARFCCALALSSPEGDVRCLEGECRGRILTEPRGKDGFGYDPLFVPDGYDVTFAEMSSGEKNRISHRSDALEKAKKIWLDLLMSAGGLDFSE